MDDLPTVGCCRNDLSKMVRHENMSQGIKDVWLFLNTFFFFTNNNLWYATLERKMELVPAIHR